MDITKNKTGRWCILVVLCLSGLVSGTRGKSVSQDENPLLEESIVDRANKLRGNVDEPLKFSEGEENAVEPREGEPVLQVADTGDTDGITLDVDPPQAQPLQQNQEGGDENDIYSGFGPFAFYAIVAGCSVAGLVGLVVAGVCWYRLQKNVKAASEAEYPAYGVTGPTKEKVVSPGDRKLAQSAQMYHYQHQKQQMIAMEKANGEMKHDASEEDSEEENEEGDYTVYECPGLAPTGEMEVKNPLFSEDTPVTPTQGGAAEPSKEDK